MGLFLQISANFARHSFLNLYKTFVRSQLNHADFIYDQAYDFSFHDKLQFVQYNT